MHYLINGRTQENVRFQAHGGGRVRHSDCYENSFIMVVYENIFLKFSQNFLSKARLKNVFS